jgi:hypothetical protein
MRNKTVSLCDKSYKIAQNMPNFSEWLRIQILKPMPVEEAEIKSASSYIKPNPPKNLLCKHCLASGHWTADCPTLGDIS